MNKEKKSMTTRNLEPDQWRNKEEWRLVSGRQQQLLKILDGWMDEWMDGWMDGRMDGWMDGWTDGWMDGRMDGWMD
jgi:hypothetical protein